MTSPEHEGLTRDESRLFDYAMHSLERDPVRLPPAVRAAIMRRIREAPAPVRQRAWRWLMMPRVLQMSPVALAATLALLVGSGALIGSRLAPPSQPQASVSPPTVTPARFALVAPAASQVTVTGNFVSWDPNGVPLKRLADGLWIAEVQLPAGIYQYVFVVDGQEWRADPNADWTVDDGLGRQNSVMVVGGGESI